MDTPPRKKSKNQPQPQEILLPDGKKVIVPPPPKKPLSPYMAFQMEKRQELLAHEPNLPFTAIGSKLGECWQKLSPEEKKVYTIRYREEYDEYKDKRQAYDKRLAELMKKHGISGAQLKAASGQTVPANVTGSHVTVQASNSKSPFQLFRDKMARQFETMNIPMGDFEKIVQNMWDKFSPEEKLLYVKLAKSLNPQMQAAPKWSAGTSSPRTSWPSSSGYSVGAPLSHAVRSPPGGGERFQPTVMPINTQRGPTLPSSPFAVYQEEMKQQTLDHKIDMANFDQTTKNIWNSFSKGEKAVYFRIYKAKIAMAMSHQAIQSGRNYDRAKETVSPTTGSTSHHSNKRPHSKSVTPSPLGSVMINPGDHLTAEQRNSLNRIKVPSYNFEVADHLGNGIGQVLEFTWKQEPMNTYLTHHGAYEEAQMPDSVCVYKEEAIDHEEMGLETELPPDAESNAENKSAETSATSQDTDLANQTSVKTEDTDKTPKIQGLETAQKSDVTNADSENNSEIKETPGTKEEMATDETKSSSSVRFSNPAIVNLLTNQTNAYIELNDSDISDNEMETTVQSMEDDKAKKKRK